MAYLITKLEKLKKKLKQSKKSATKCARDSLSSNSNSDSDSGSGSTNDHLDKRLKLDKPTGIDLKPTGTHRIKATITALAITKANKKAIENSKTGKVTAVVGSHQDSGE
jgi:hypothetical protein